MLIYKLKRFESLVDHFPYGQAIGGWNCAVTQSLLFWGTTSKTVEVY